MIDRKAADLLWRHVSHCPEEIAGRCDRRRPAAERVGGDQFGDAEVEDLHHPRTGNEDVLRLQIAVHQPLLVRSGEPSCELHGMVEDGHVPSVHSLPQRHAVELFRDDARPAVELVDVVNDDDIRVLQRPGCARLLLETAQRGLVLRCGGKDLDRHLAAELPVVRGEHRSHSATA